jgi:hypothetical protein
MSIVPICFLLNSPLGISTDKMDDWTNLPLSFPDQCKTTHDYGEWSYSVRAPTCQASGQFGIAGEPGS